MTVLRFATRTPPIPDPVDTFETRRRHANPKGLVWWVALVGRLELPASGGWVGWVGLLGLLGLVGLLGLAGFLG